MGDNIETLYENVINASVNGYKDLCGVVSRITNLIPELDINGAAGINNYS